MEDCGFALDADIWFSLPSTRISDEAHRSVTARLDDWAWRRFLFLWLKSSLVFQVRSVRMAEGAVPT
jgi:hypothetical protein